MTARSTPPENVGERRVCGAPKRNGLPCARVVLGQDGRCAAHTTLPEGEWVSAASPDPETASRRSLGAIPVVVEGDLVSDRPVDGERERPAGGFRERLAQQTDESWEAIVATLEATIE